MSDDSDHRLTPPSPAALSIAASSSAAKSSICIASRESSSCSTVRAPISAEVTRGSRKTHAIAIWASVCPRAPAIPFKVRMAARFRSVSSAIATRHGWRAHPAGHGEGTCSSACPAPTVRRRCSRRPVPPASPAGPIRSTGSGSNSLPLTELHRSGLAECAMR